MKIMLLCAGGMSTGILMKKMEKWAQENGTDLEVKAYGVNGYQSHVSEYDLILLGPQISYKEKEVRESVSIPVAQIAPMDYALGNVEVIMAQANKMIL